MKKHEHFLFSSEAAASTFPFVTPSFPPALFTSRRLSTTSISGYSHLPSVTPSLFMFLQTCLGFWTSNLSPIQVIPSGQPAPFTLITPTIFLHFLETCLGIEPPILTPCLRLHPPAMLHLLHLFLLSQPLWLLFLSCSHLHPCHIAEVWTSNLLTQRWSSANWVTESHIRCVFLKSFSLLYTCSLAKAGAKAWNQTSPAWETVTLTPGQQAQDYRELLVEEEMFKNRNLVGFKPSISQPRGNANPTEPKGFIHIGAFKELFCSSFQIR